MSLRPRVARAAPTGFTLIEVLVGLAILSAGLLGAAAMLLDSLRSNAGALQNLRSTHLVRDMADRIRANSSGREHYDTRRANAGGRLCTEPEGCEVAQLAAADRAHFDAAARALFLHDNYAASIEFEPAIGPASPGRYVITLRWHGAHEAAGDFDSVALQVLAQMPVAG